MMQTDYIHLLKPMHRDENGRIVFGTPVRVEGPMIEGQRTANEMAVEKKCDVRHECYGHKWTILGVYHPDGTATDSFGDTRRFTGNARCPWEELYEEAKGGER